MTIRLTSAKVNLWMPNEPVSPARLCLDGLRDPYARHQREKQVKVSTDLTILDDFMKKYVVATIDEFRGLWYR